MKQIQTVQDVYPAVDELVVDLKTSGESRLAAILHHRMHQVAWTTGSELLEELQDVLAGALKSEAKLPQSLKKQMERILHVIRDFRH